MAKYIIIAGLIIVAIGIVLYFFPSAFRWVGRLPGDIRVHNKNSDIYFPITTMLLASVVISLILFLIRKMS